MEQCVISYQQSTINRGLFNLIALIVFLSSATYFAEFKAKLASLKEATLTAQIFVTIFALCMALIITYLLVISIRDVLLNSKFGLKLYETYLVFSEPNNWMNKSYKLDYKDIVEIHKEYWGESNEFYVKTRGGKRYDFPNLKDESAEHALAYLSNNLKHVKVVIDGSKNT